MMGYSVNEHGEVWSVLDNAWVTVEHWEWVNGRGR
jgi:hypothetical protein